MPGDAGDGVPAPLQPLLQLLHSKRPLPPPLPGGRAKCTSKPELERVQGAAALPHMAALELLRAASTAGLCQMDAAALCEWRAGPCSGPLVVGG